MRRVKQIILTEEITVDSILSQIDLTPKKPDRMAKAREAKARKKLINDTIAMIQTKPPKKSEPGQKKAYPVCLRCGEQHP